MIRARRPGLSSERGPNWALAALLLTAACADPLLGAERFAWATPAEKAAAVGDAPDTATVDAGDTLGGDGAADDTGALDAGAGVPDVGVGKTCGADLDCVAFDDGDLCNGIWHCDLADNPPICKPKPKSAVDCPIDSDGVCSVSICHAPTGKCSLAAVPDGAPCDDGDGCTGGDVCVGGVCSAGVGLACACTQDADCLTQDDGDPCNGVWRCLGSGATAACAIDPLSVVVCEGSANTGCVDNVCEPLSGQCVMKATHEGDPCVAQGNMCTAATVCQSGKCLASGAGECDDGNPCTVNACDPAKGCVFKSMAMDGKACDADGQPCVTADTCKNGSCQSGPPKNCDDGDPCTKDACDPDTGACTHAKSC